MLVAIFAAPLLSLAQTVAEPPKPPRTVNEDRLALCLDQARNDPASAISDANEWAEGLAGADTSYPQQCLGYAYSALLRWQAAEGAFLLARDAVTDPSRRARLGAMAANAALAENRASAALAILEVATRDALGSGDGELRAMVEVDRARAQVLAGDEAGAETTLASARTLDAQSPLAWLLSATLARRLGKLEEAQRFIETAAVLDSKDPEVPLEAGVIAILSGREDAAAASWNSVIAVAPNSSQATTARGYLAQITEPKAQ